MKKLIHKPKPPQTYDRFIKTTPMNLAMRAIERGWQMHEIMGCVTEQISDEEWVIDILHPQYPMDYHPSISDKLSYQQKMTAAAIRHHEEMGGAGTELKALLGRFGIKASANCSCNKRMITMNSKGVKWCKDNIEVIVGWLRNEAKKRKLPFADFLGRKLIKMAIKRAEKKGHK